MLTFTVSPVMSDDALTQELGGCAINAFNTSQGQERDDLVLEVTKLIVRWPLLTVPEALAVLAVTGGIHLGGS